MILKTGHLHLLLHPKVDAGHALSVVSLKLMKLWKLVILRIDLLHRLHHHRVAEGLVPSVASQRSMRLWKLATPRIVLRLLHLPHRVDRVEGVPGPSVAS